MKEADFLRAVAARPGTLPLYADWLKERGRDAEAEALALPDMGKSLCSPFDYQWDSSGRREEGWLPLEVKEDGFGCGLRGIGDGPFNGDGGEVIPWSIGALGEGFGSGWNTGFVDGDSYPY